MLRLTRIAGTHQTETIKLEGKLLGPWVDEVRQACAAGTDPASRINLDLSALIFVDGAGERLLRDLIARGFEVVACSGYVTELLRSSAGRPLSLTYYQVLDISPDEQDARVIEEAALRCSTYVRAYQLTREAECTLRLNEIAQALNTLLDPARRREYDLSLGKCLGPALRQRRPHDEPDTPVLLQGKSAPPAQGEDARMFLIGDERTCDVKLVYRRCAW
jgi:hypothetical protein